MNPFPAARPTPSQRREWIFIAAMTIVGLGVRIGGLGRIGLVHFDEGIYAISGLWPVQQGELDAAAIPYAPPGYPLLIALFYTVLGPRDVSAVLASIVMGTLTAPVLAWLARRTFGPGAGATASALAALSGFHVVYSRMAMTDATFTFCWLLGLIAAQWFLERPGPATALPLGLATGLAQLVKYSGWTVGITAAFAAAALTALDPARRTAAYQRRVWGWGMLAAALAAVVYAPWYQFVEVHGGYAGLMTHHRGYMGTPATWLPFWTAQMNQLSVLSGGFSWNLAAVVAVAVGAWIVGAGGRTMNPSSPPERKDKPRSGQMRGRPASEEEEPSSSETSGDSPPHPALRATFPREGGRPVAAIGLVALAVASVVAPTTLWWIGLALAVFAWREASPRLLLLGVAWVWLSILTPFYHPYARLWLPIQSLGWLAAAGVVRDLLDPTATPRRRPWLVVACCAAAVGQTLLTGTTFGRVGDRPGLLAPTDSLRVATLQALADLPDKSSGIRVLGRPPVNFYVGSRMEMWRVPDVDGLLSESGGPWALVDVAQLRQAGDAGDLSARLSRKWERVGEYPSSLNLPTLLDVDPGAAIRVRPGEADAPLWLFRLRPGVPR